VRTTYSYDPFGAVTISGETSDNPFQYTGRENDGTGLYYYRARYYSPELQRFISEDPINLTSIQLPQEISSYRSFNAYLKLIQLFPMNKTFVDLISQSEIPIYAEIIIQTQLLLNPLKQNLYGYVENSPINKIDPTGLSNTCCKAGCGALGAACILACPASGPMAPICIATCIVGADMCGKGCDKSFPPGDKKDKK
jgi:RHS repeat-associated protein